MSARPHGAALPAREQAPGRSSPLRFISAASLFDGHDAAINMIRRLLQAHGAEVVHLGHNRSVADIVRAAIQEDADAVAVSSYQGGHNEYFQYMVDMLRERGRPDIRVIVGGEAPSRLMRSRRWSAMEWRRSIPPRTVGRWVSTG
jgi:methylmalonyl-CoA mutase